MSNLEELYQADRQLPAARALSVLSSTGLGRGLNVDKIIGWNKRRRSRDKMPSVDTCISGLQAAVEDCIILEDSTCTSDHEDAANRGR